MICLFVSLAQRSQNQDFDFTQVMRRTDNLDIISLWAIRTMLQFYYYPSTCEVKNHKILDSCKPLTKTRNMFKAKITSHLPVITYLFTGLCFYILLLQISLEAEVNKLLDELCQGDFAVHISNSMIQWSKNLICANECSTVTSRTFSTFYHRCYHNTSNEM